MTNLVPRVPWYSRPGSSRSPMCDSSPDSSAVCTRSVSTKSTRESAACAWASAAVPGRLASIASGVRSTGRRPRRRPPAAELRPVADRPTCCGPAPFGDSAPFGRISGGRATGRRAVLGLGYPDHGPGLGVHLQPAGHLAQLRMQILPFPNPQVVQVFRPAHSPEGVAGTYFRLIGEIVPEVQRGQEIGLRDRRIGRARRSPAPGPPVGTPGRPGWPGRR